MVVGLLHYFFGDLNVDVKDFTLWILEGFILSIVLFTVEVEIRGENKYPGEKWWYINEGNVWKEGNVNGRGIGGMRKEEKWGNTRIEGIKK